LSQFLDWFSYYTEVPSDFSTPPVKHLVAAEALGRPPFGSVTVFHRAGPVGVTQSLTAAADLARKPLSRDLTNAVTFYRRSLKAETSDEALIDLIISLESMLSIGAQDGRYRISLRAAYLVGESNVDLRKQIYTFVHEMYGFRNKIMHSGETPEIDFLKIVHLRQIVRDTIAKYLQLTQSKEAYVKKLDSNIITGRADQ